MTIRPAVFQRQAHVFTSTSFVLSTENTWNCRRSFQESRDGYFLCFTFPSTFQQSFSCLCTTPLLSWEPGDQNPWLDHGSFWGLCVFRSTFGTRTASHNTALSLVGVFWPGVENFSSIYTYLAMHWILSLFQPRPLWQPNLAMMSITVNDVPIAKLLVKVWHGSIVPFWLVTTSDYHSLKNCDHEVSSCDPAAHPLPHRKRGLNIYYFSK